MLLAYPRVVAVNATTRIQLRACKPMFAKGEFSALLTSCERFRNERDAVDTEIISDFPVSHSSHKPILVELEKEDDYTLSLELTFAREQEYILRVVRRTAPSRVLEAGYVYAVREDLQGLYPFKGDFHMHSWHSDGNNAPETMAVCCREKGYDFMALTDHGKWRPSVYLKERFGRMNDLAMQMYTGEEVHLPCHQAHILNIGATASVNETFRQDMDRFEAEVQEIIRTTDVPELADPYMYCSALWAFRKIKEYGGMSVFCHPYWRRAAGVELCGDLTDAILEAQDFDAFELISGYIKAEVDSNQLQLARYYELEHRPPIVGVSDSHHAFEKDVPEGEYLLGSYYTIVLAPDNRFESVRDGILGYRSVAVENLPKEQRHIFGGFRMVRYFQFLERTFFPEHDEIARQEAAAMAMIDEGATGRAAAMESLYKRAFAW